MRIALLDAAAALLSFSAAHAFNPQPDPPGRHITMDARGRCCAGRRKTPPLADRNRHP